MRRRNTWRKVARKYFCKDASNPSEPTGRNTSDSELEKRPLKRGREFSPLWKNYEEFTIVVASIPTVSDRL